MGPFLLLFLVLLPILGSFPVYPLRDYDRTWRNHYVRLLPALEPPYRIHRTYRYGKIGLTIYHRDGNQENEEQVP